MLLQNGTFHSKSALNYGNIFHAHSTSTNFRGTVLLAEADGAASDEFDVFEAVVNGQTAFAVTGEPRTVVGIGGLQARRALFFSSPSVVRSACPSSGGLAAWFRGGAALSGV